MFALNLLIGFLALPFSAFAAEESTETKRYRAELSALEGAPRRAFRATYEGSYEIAGPRVWHKPSAARPFAEKSGHAAAFLRQRVESACPRIVVDRLRANPATAPRVNDNTFTWNDADLGARTLSWKPGVAGLDSITRTYAHPRRGDTRNVVEYGKWAAHGGVWLPETFVLREFDGEDVLNASPGTFDMRLESLAARFDVGSELDDPAPTAESPALPRDTTLATIEVEQGWVGTW